MTLSKVRGVVAQKILRAVQTDDRIRGCLDYGSTSEGRGDEWSDVDLALFIKDEAIESFGANWKAWVEQFGDVLLAYIGGVGHPWVVYAAQPIPLRVDFAFHAASTMDVILAWPNSPVSIEKMVWVDKTDGQLSSVVEQIVGKSLAPDDLARAFEQVCGDFWYYLLRTQTRLLRGDIWAGRHEFNFIIIGNLAALLRLECDAVERWGGSSALAGLERVLSPTRLAQLDACIVGRSQKSIQEAMLASAELGYEVSGAIAQAHNLPWPDVLAREIVAMLQKGVENADREERG